MADEKVQIVVTAQDKASPTISKLKTNIGSLGSKTGGPLGNAAAGFSALGLSTIGAGVAIGALTELGGQVSAFLGDSISQAITLDDTMAKVKNVFKENSEEIVSWAQTADMSLGLSKGAALDAASAYAGLFKTVGDSEGEATDHAKRMVQLAVDLRSAFGGDLQSAIASVRSGLSGESEPMKKFNVFLSETAVNSRLVAMGLKKTSGQWTEQQKVMARMQIMLEQTVDSENDFIETQEGAASASQQFAAVMENIKTDIGEDFIPLMQDGARGAVELTQSLKGLVDLVEGGLGVEELDVTNPLFQGLIGGLEDQLPGPLADALRGSMNEATERGLREAANDIRDAQETKNFGAVMAHSMAVASDEAAKSEAMKLRQIGSFMGSEVAERFAHTFEYEAKNNFAAALGDIRFGEMLTDDLASELKAGVHDDIDSAMSKVTWAIKHPLQLAKQTAAIEGALTTLEYKRGLAGNTPEVNAVIDQQILGLQQRWSSLTGIAYEKGVNASNALEKGLRTFTPPNLPIFAGIRTGAGGKYVGNNYDPGHRGPGGRAAGGPVNQGGTYVVGERGPELLTMGRNSGRITPNHGLGGGTIVVNIDGRELFRIMDTRAGRAQAIAPGGSYSRGT